MFVKLTAANGSQIWVNDSHIESFGTISRDNYDCSEDYIGLTYLCMGDDGGNYAVRESPEDIRQALSLDGVRLTPIKPIERNDRLPGGQYDCPICGCGVGWFVMAGQRHFNEVAEKGHVKMHYCPMCGQKLDWEGIK